MTNPKQNKENQIDHKEGLRWILSCLWIIGTIGTLFYGTIERFLLMAIFWRVFYK